MMRAMTKGVGAKTRQLLQALVEMEGELQEGVRDLVEMLRAVIVTFQDDDEDENVPDEVDQWVRSWLRCIQIWTDMESLKLNNQCRDCGGLHERHDCR